MHTWHEFKRDGHHYWRLRDADHREMAMLFAVYAGWRFVRRDGVRCSEALPTLEAAMRAAVA